MNISRTSSRLVLTVFVLTLCSAKDLPAENRQRPNVLFISVDDLDDLPPAGKKRGPNRYFDHIRAHKQWKQGIQGYLASIAFADAMVGRVIDALESGPNRDNTIVVLWSDHGWHLGEKQHWQKFTAWRACTRVPLIVRVPAGAPGLPGGTPVGSTCAKPVNLLSLYPTLTELAGLPHKSDNDGPSIVPLLRDPDADWPRVSITYLAEPGSYGLSAERWRYIHYANGDEELYDCQTDPYEWTNLANSPNCATKLNELRGRAPRNFASSALPKETFLPKLKWHAAADARAEASAVYQANGIKIGEVTQTTAIVWTRLTNSPELNATGTEWTNTRKPDGKSPIPEGKTLADMEASVPGAQGSVHLSYRCKDSPDEIHETPWVEVDPQADFTHQFQLVALRSGSSYQLTVRSRTADQKQGPNVKGCFRTAPSADQSRRVSFTVVTGQDYPRRDNKVNGHKIYPLMHELNPDFFIHTGDIEYYDKPKPLATNVALARYKWNRLFALPFQRDFQNVTASYFMKDDHDTLRNDCWPGQTYGDLTWDQGLAIFREQVPMGEKTYRTIRWGKDLQIWLVEGRDFRSPNKMPDGPGKTIWGNEQKQWFFQTVEASDATFKILISPTPLVGPDRTGKGDNHANTAFAYEGRQLRDFIGKQKNMFICCGDRHWQYISVDPDSGVREYSCGPTSDKHAGGWSNDKRSSMHRYLNVVGGFLSVTVRPDSGGKPVAIFRHYGTHGKVLNEDRQVAR